MKRSCLMVLIFLLVLPCLWGCGMKYVSPDDQCPFDKEPTLSRPVWVPSSLVDMCQGVQQLRRDGKDRTCPQGFEAYEKCVTEAWTKYKICNCGHLGDPNNCGSCTFVCEQKVIATPMPTPTPMVEEKKEVVIVLEDAHFDFDKATLTKEAQEILAKDTQVLNDNPGVKVRIEGNTCSHGPDDYNLRLGERRAQGVMEFLVNKGIAADRLSTISYGKTRPLCVEEPTPKNKNDECMTKNRRVHFEVIAQ